jgi:heme-degrading monooxygenase HmoA
MLQRVWRCMIDPDRAGDYEDFARTVSLPMVRAQPGFRGCLMTRQGAACEVLTLWDGLDAIEALNASLSYQATVAKILATGFILREQGTTVTQVHLASLGEASEAPYPAESHHHAQPEE